MADETRTPGTMGGLRGKGSKKKKKRVLTADEFLKIKDSKQEFTGPKATQDSLGDTVNKFRKIDDDIKRVQKLSKGGRAGYKVGKSVKKKGGCAIKGRSKILR